jgi:hypothetical protein
MLQPCIVVILQEVQNLVLEGFSTSRPYPAHIKAATLHTFSPSTALLYCAALPVREEASHGRERLTLDQA